MTKTIQSDSYVLFKKEDKELNKKNKTEEENMSFLLSICDGLSKLSDKLSLLNYVLLKKKMEQMLIFDDLNKLNEELCNLDCVPKEIEQIIRNQNKGEKK